MSLTCKVPKLRFGEFSGEWIDRKLGDISKTIIAGGTPSTLKEEYWNGDIRWMSSGELNYKRVYEVHGRITEVGLKKSSTKMIPIGCILIGLAGQGKTRGTVAMNMVELCTNQSIASIFPNDKIFNNNFLYHDLDRRYDELRKLSTGDGGRGGLNLQIIKFLTITLPNLSEQQKIASFLSAVDIKIDQLTRKKELLEQYKKGVMQKIFSQEIRFKADDESEFPEWEEKMLNELLAEPKERNSELFYTKNDVLSVSGTNGIVNQIEFQGRSFAGESIANYHIVKHGYIVYTKSPLKANPYGIIKVNKGKDGVVSTLYAVYSCKNTANGVYLDYYFQLDDNTNSYLRPLVHKGAKNDMKINNSHVLSGSMIIPSIQEQNKIVNFLVSIDTKIDFATKQLEEVKKFKKGLLQQMFV